MAEVKSSAWARFHQSAIFPHALALVAYLILSIILLGPLDPGAEIWGNNTTDVFAKLNLRAWQALEAASGNPFPLYNNYLMYPDGARLFLADAVGGVLLIPVVWIFGAIVAYNVLTVANLLFGCWSMFWLVGRLSKDRWAALVAGAVYGLSPQALGHINNGVTEIQQIGWLPLFVGGLLALYEDARRPTTRKRLAKLVMGTAVAWWFASVASHWYFGMFASLVMALAFVTLALRAWDIRAVSRLALRFAAAGALFFVLILPVIMVFLSCIEDETTISRSLRSMTNELPEFRADPAFFFNAKKPQYAHEEIYMHLTYLGFTLPLLSLFGLLRAGRRAQVVGSLLAALAFISLSLGPGLVYAYQVIDIPILRTILPYNFFHQVVPFFGSINFPYRFFTLVYLFLAMAAGVGIAQLIPGKRFRGALYLAALAAVVADYAYLSGAMLPMPRQKIHTDPQLLAMGAGPERFAVFDLPVLFSLDALNRYAVNQLVHQRPIVYCNFPTARYPFAKSLAQTNLAANLLAVASIELLDDPKTPFFPEGLESKLEFKPQASRLLKCIWAQEPCDLTLADSLEKDLKSLKSQGITRFVVHHDLLPDAKKMLQLCRVLFGAPVSSQGKGVSIFVLKDARIAQAINSPSAPIGGTP